MDAGNPAGCDSEGDAGVVQKELAEGEIRMEIYVGYRWERQTKEHLQNPKFLEGYGYKVYSQNDEDGILQEIFDRIGTETKRFVEFGVQNGLECNSHYLLHKGWTGLWLEGNESFCRQIQEKFAYVISKGLLKIDCVFITRENINQKIEEWTGGGEIDLLSIDVDGNDYHIWDAISCITPRVVCIEYNGRFSPDCEWAMPYFSEHVWQGNDYFGASLKALENLGRKKGYQLVGTNLTGVNAFFVRTDLAQGKFPEPATAENLYNAPQYERKYITGHPNEFCLIGEDYFRPEEASEVSKSDMILIDEQTDADMLFAALENTASKRDYIVIENGMCNYGIQQPIWCFLDRYRMLLEYVHITGASETTKSEASAFGRMRIYIKLKSIIDNLGQLSYSALANSYTESYFMTDCGGYSEFRKSCGMEMTPRLQDIYSLVEPEQGERILDVGCGRGELAFALASAGAQVEGVDYSENAIAVARKTFDGKCANLHYTHADIFRMNDLHTFDKIVMADVVEHIEQEILEKIFEKISVSLSQNGCLIIHTAPNKDYYEIMYPQIREQASRFGYWKPRNPRSYYEQLMHINEQTPKGLETALKKYFQCVKVWTGSVWEINEEKTPDESCRDMEIFAIASQAKSVLERKTARSQLNEKPELSDYQVLIEMSDATISVWENEQAITVDVIVTNLGNAPILSSRRCPINLSYHILNQNGDIILFDGERTSIRPEIWPGSKRSMQMRLRIPPNLDSSKEYICRITLVAEGCFWFDQEGENKKDIPICIQSFGNENRE